MVLLLGAARCCCIVLLLGAARCWCLHGAARWCVVVVVVVAAAAAAAVVAVAGRSRLSQQENLELVRVKNRLDQVAAEGQTGVSHMLLNLKWTAPQVPRVVHTTTTRGAQRERELGSADSSSSSSSSPSTTTTTTTTTAAAVDAVDADVATRRPRTWGDYLRDPQTFKLFSDVERMQHDVRQNRVCV